MLYFISAVVAIFMLALAFACIRCLSKNDDFDNVESGKQDFIYYWEESLEMQEQYIERHLDEKYFKK